MTAQTDTTFDVVLKSSGQRVAIPPGRSILETLEEHGVIVANVCREGICGTCETGIIAGEVDHRDHVLEESERPAATTMMICVSRCRGGELVLDL